MAKKVVGAHYNTPNFTCISCAKAYLSGALCEETIKLILPEVQRRRKKVLEH
jgi:hypothetical protein